MSKNINNNQTTFVLSGEFKGYTTVTNHIFQCKELSYKAIGIYCSIVQFQNSSTHSISIRSLMAVHSDGERSVRSGLDELIEHGFLTREYLREGGKIIGCVYTVYCQPVKRETIDNTEFQPKRQNVDTENVDTENAVHINKISKNKISKNKNLSLAEAPGEKIDTHENIVLIKNKTGLKLSVNQIKKAMAWDCEKLKDAIDLFINHNGKSFTYLAKCYATPIESFKQTISQQTEAKVKSKNPHFTNTYSHNWDIDELERKEREYINNKYGEETIMSDQQFYSNDHDTNKTKCKKLKDTMIGLDGKKDKKTDLDVLCDTTNVF